MMKTLKNDEIMKVFAVMMRVMAKIWGFDDDFNDDIRNANDHKMANQKSCRY